MSKELGYPRVELDLKKLKHNIDAAVEICRKQGVGIAGVVKGFNGLKEGMALYEQSDCDFVASSRLEQLEGAREIGITKPLMLIRVPMLSEVAEAVRLADLSLNSEIEVLKALNAEAGNQKKIHGVILMVDLGDLREGFWDGNELLQAALLVEHDLKNLELRGIGTNLGCYGSVAATPEKMEELIAHAEIIEKAIGRQLEIISGGATSSLPLVLKEQMPARINNLRLGEGIILGKDLMDLYGYDMSFLNQDAFILKAEIIELKDKPTYPVGELAFDAFGNVGTYEDRGIRKRALLALGKVDFAYPESLIPVQDDVQVLGASSDHLIIDVEDSKRDWKVGDVMEFYLCYATIVFVTNSPNIQIVCKN